VADAIIAGLKICSPIEVVVDPECEGIFL